VKPIDLDHIALAAEHAWDNFDRYRGDLGGVWIAGTPAPGFYWGQVRFANGMTLEMLEPANTHLDDFLVRFLARSGPGPHHLTFMVPDIVAAMDAAAAAGYPPVRSDLSQDNWKEAFLHPKACHGIVVQLAQTPFADSSQEFPTPEFASVIPPARVAEPASLDRIVHLVASVDGALTLFGDLLGGRVDRDTVDDAGSRTVDVSWPGPGRLRLVEPRDDARGEWLGERSGRVHYVEFTIAEPAMVPHARPNGDGTFTVDPADNLGVRLLLRAR
jgi:catechol 2,3-dioxygenase-like lactoylglutathione lyase family enzyme